MNLQKRSFLKKEVLDTIQKHGLMIGVNGEAATITKKDDQYSIHIGRALLFSGDEKETLDYLVVTYSI